MTSRDRGKKGNRPWTQDDRAVWAHIARQVKPLKNKKTETNTDPAFSAPASGAAFHPPPQAETRITAPATPHRPSPPAPDSRHPGSDAVDRRTDDRLRKGRMRPEARLDLHGMTQDTAHVALIAFLTSAHATGKRCVLVITGKGDRKKAPAAQDWLSRPPGILRERVPVWLATPPLDRIILRTHTAQPRDGGTGALYILLRRIRD